MWQYFGNCCQWTTAIKWKKSYQKPIQQPVKGSQRKEKQQSNELAGLISLQPLRNPHLPVRPEGYREHLSQPLRSTNVSVYLFFFLAHCQIYNYLSQIGLKACQRWDFSSFHLSNPPSFPFASTVNNPMRRGSNLQGFCTNMLHLSCGGNPPNKHNILLIPEDLKGRQGIPPRCCFRHHHLSAGLFLWIAILFRWILHKELELYSLMTSFKVIFPKAILQPTTKGLFPSWRCRWKVIYTCLFFW